MYFFIYFYSFCFEGEGSVGAIDVHGPKASLASDKNSGPGQGSVSQNSRNFSGLFRVPQLIPFISSQR